MSTSYAPYSPLKKWFNKNIKDHLTSTGELNQFHDTVMKHLFAIALHNIKLELGPPPCKFSWFVMGSTGRFEQAVVSDQDHGLIYEKPTKEARKYFLKLGKEVTFGLYTIGYPYCDGNVMSSNPLWCKSKQEWRFQLTKWMEEASFESIRFLLIFYDARVLVGERWVCHLKQQFQKYIKKNPDFLHRLLINTLHIKRSIGVFRQLLPETHGTHAGCLNLKHSAFFPFVNAIRLLAMKEDVRATSTLLRLDKLLESSEYAAVLDIHRTDFELLLQYRLQYHKKEQEQYGDVHYLNVKELDKSEIRKIKQILMDGKRLQDYTKHIIRGYIK